MALTPKKRRFIDEYLVDLNGAQGHVEETSAAPRLI